MCRSLLALSSVLVLGLAACTTENEARQAGADLGAIGATDVIGSIFNVPPVGEVAAQRATHEELPACRNGADPFWCLASPLAPGSWVGEGSPFADLEFRDTVCADDGYCFSGDLRDGTPIAGTYFVRPEMLKMTWDGGELIGLPPTMEEGGLVLYRPGADEGHPVEIERFRPLRAL